MIARFRVQINFLSLINTLRSIRYAAHGHCWRGWGSGVAGCGDTNNDIASGSLIQPGLSFSHNAVDAPMLTLKTWSVDNHPAPAPQQSRGIGLVICVNKHVNHLVIYPHMMASAASQPQIIFWFVGIVGNNDDRRAETSEVELVKAPESVEITRTRQAGNGSVSARGWRPVKSHMGPTTYSKSNPDARLRYDPRQAGDGGLIPAYRSPMRCASKASY